MGCGNSKRKPQFNFRMDEIGIKEVDDLFVKLAGLLEILNQQLFKFQNSWDDFMFYSGVEYFLKEKTITNAMKSMSFMCATIGNGDPEKVGMKIQKESPYFVVDINQLNSDNLKMYESFKTLFEVLQKSPEILEPIKESVQELIQSAKQLAQNLPEMIKIKLKGAQALKAAKRFATNMHKLKQAPKLVQAILEVTKNFALELVDFVNYAFVQNGPKEIKAIATKASEQGIKNCWELIPAL